MRLIDADALKYRRKDYGGYDDVGDDERKRGILFLLKEDIAEAPTIDPVKWIPCAVKLPEDKKAVYWVCNDNGDQFECRWTNASYFWTEPKTKWHWSLFDVPQYSKVVAWMPLPEPYKERSEE